MKRYWFIALFFFLMACVGAAALIYTGIIWPNTPSKRRYPVRGVDVSHYQGEIDWDMLAGQDIDFAFIKATEGSSYQDSRFIHNWEHAAKTDLYIGAYHFFSNGSSGKSQADNYINTVPKKEEILPPVVDVEVCVDDNNESAILDVREKLTELLLVLEDHYGVKPVIYVTKETYFLYITDAYTGYDIWIRSLLTKPRLPDKRDWTFWQYSNRGRLCGYSGDERYIDLNVFNGTLEDFYAYTGGIPVGKEE